MLIKDCKIGMKVRCVRGTDTALKEGEIYTIDDIDGNCISVKYICGYWDLERFAPVTNIFVKKLTPTYLASKACEFTSNKSIKDTKDLLDFLYRAEHSPMRTQMFWVEMRDIPTFVSVHLVRHKIGVEHFVQSNRTDVVETIADRNTPINHAMLLNAQSLVNIARKRLCMKASKETREVMQEIKNKVGLVDEILPKYMVKDCEYRGKCVERNPCKGV